MQKIEKWRIEELALVLNHLSQLLRRGDNCEWANVFSHFHQESKQIVEKNEFDQHLLKKLVINIKNCFTGLHSLRNIVLWHLNTRESANLNQEFQRYRARLLKIIEYVEKRLIEYIN